MATPFSDIYSDFLRLCLMGRRIPAHLEQAWGLAARTEFDWQACVQRGQAEGVLPLLHDALRGSGRVPAHVQGELAEAYFATGLQNMLGLAELARVIEGLQAAGTVVIVLKGAALAELLYGNPALRPMLDLDILMRRDDVPSALDVLAGLGYVCALREVQLADALAYENEVALGKPGDLGTMLEVHWSLLDSPYYQSQLDMTWFWETARPLQLGDVACLQLGAEAQLLHLAAHLHLHHQGGILLWWNDVVESLVCEGDRLDWDLVLAKAVTFDLVKPLQQTLWHAVEVWHAPVPPMVMQRVSALRPSADEERVFGLFTEQRESVAQRFWADLATMPGLGTKVRYAWRSLVPSRDYMRERYAIRHDVMVPVYYGYRWWRGIKDILRRIVARPRS